MSGMLDTLMSHLNDGGLQQLSSALGTDPATTGSAVSAAIPVLVAALARNASQPAGATALAGALDRDHDGSGLDNISALLNSGGADGEKILAHVLGAKQAPIAQSLGALTGLDAAKTTKLLVMLAPMVLAYLGKQKRDQHLDAGGLGSMLGQAQQAMPQSGGMLGSVMSMLDRNHDGSVIDDVGGIVGKMFG